MAYLPYLTESPEGILITLKVVPGSSRTELAGLHGDMLKMKVAAPPEKGKANRSIVNFLCDKLQLKKNAVYIQTGQTSCIKKIMLRGASKQDVEKLFT